MAIAIEASTVDATMPNAGTPLGEIRLNCVGEQPVLRRRQRHLCADHRPAVERPEPGDDHQDGHHVARPTCRRRSTLAASENGAVAVPSWVAGRMPNTAISDSM